MTRIPKAFGPTAALLLAVAAQAAQAADPAGTGTTGQDASATARVSRADRALIASAMRAAPGKVGANATVVVARPDGSMRTLREGTNGFTCMPDNPATPGPDPMCMDKAALDWAGAWMSQRAPEAGRIGFMYMLAGGTDASNVDPFAKKPEPGNHWIETGPHVMIVGADPRFYDMYPKRPDPDTSAPYVMWPGTPYQHLMIPVR